MSPLAVLRAIVIAAVLTPAAALAHGATPQKVVETIEIAAPPAKVWAVVGDFQDMGWLPGVVKTEGEGGVTPEIAKRRLFLAGGGVIDERLVQYDAAAMSLRYIIEHVDFAVLPVGNLSATLKVSPAPSGGSVVEWKSRFYRAFPGGNPPEQYTDESGDQGGVRAVQERPRGAKGAGGARINLRALAVVFLAPLLVGAARADEAFIPNQSSDDLTIVDLGAMTPGATLPIGGKPAGIAVCPDGARAYVTSPEGHFVSVIDARARRVLKRIAVAGQPFGVAVSPDGRQLYVADMNGRELLEIDPDSEKTRRVEIGAMPSGVAATPDGRFVIAAARDDNALVVIDAETFARVATIAVGRHPYGVTIDARGRRAYTANVESDDVSVIDLAERKLIATAPVGSHPYGVALAKGRAFVANQYAETVSVFDTATLAPLATIKVGEYPESVGVSRDGGTIYVTNWFSNELWSIDAESYKITGKTPTGDGPRAFGAFVRAVD